LKGFALSLIVKDAASDVAECWYTNHRSRRRHVQRWNVMWLQQSDRDWCRLNALETRLFPLTVHRAAVTDSITTRININLLNTSRVSDRTTSFVRYSASERQPIT